MCIRDSLSSELESQVAVVKNVRNEIENICKTDIQLSNINPINNYNAESHHKVDMDVGLTNCILDFFSPFFLLSKQNIKKRNLNTVRIHD